MTTMERERGSATVLGLGVIAVMVSILTVIGGLALAVNTQYRAHAAADFAALAGATTLNDPRATGDPCERARQTAHDIAVTTCTISGAYVDIETTTDVSFLGMSFEIRGSARAGPAHLGQ